jgi:site-specific recombinase XerC
VLKLVKKFNITTKMADKDTIAKFSVFLALNHYSPSTVKSYAAHLVKLQELSAQTPIERFNVPRILSKIVEFIEQRNYGASTKKLLVHWREYDRSYCSQNHFFYGAHRKV